MPSVVSYPSIVLIYPCALYLTVGLLLLLALTAALCYNVLYPTAYLTRCVVYHLLTPTVFVSYYWAIMVV